MAVDPRNFLKINNLSPLSKTDELLTASALALQSQAVPLCADTARLDEIEKKVEDLIETGRKLGLEVAADRLEYWFNGSGGKYPFDINWLRSIYNVSLGESKNLERFVTGDGDKEKSLVSIASQSEDGVPVYLKDYWKYDIIVPTSTDSYLAFGRAKLISKGSFSINRAGESIHISGTVEHHFKDRYDFNPDGSYSIPGYILEVSNAELNLLSGCRNARDFDQDTCWRQIIDTTITFPPARFSLTVVETKPIDCSDSVIMIEVED